MRPVITRHTCEKLTGAVPQPLGRQHVPPVPTRARRRPGSPPQSPCCGRCELKDHRKPPARRYIAFNRTLGSAGQVMLGASGMTVAARALLGRGR